MQTIDSRMASNDSSPDVKPRTTMDASAYLGTDHKEQFPQVALNSGGSTLPLDAPDLQD